MIFQNFGFNRQAIKVTAATPATGSVVTSGLIAYYDIGNAGGYSGTTLYDLSGNGNDATLTGGASYSGSNGGVISMNGTSAYVLVPNSVQSAIQATNIYEASIQLWIKLQTSPPASDPQTGFMQFTAQNNGIGVHYPYTDNNIYINTLKDIRPSYGNPITNLAVWHYTTISTKPVDNGGTWDFYINTGLQGTGDGLNNFTLITPIKIGEAGGGNDVHLQGALGPILIYNKKISTAERNQNAAYFASRF
jgi:hypothetical protein